MKLLLATDAWHPQVNGVVRTLSTVIEELRKLGHTVEVIHPGDYPDVPLPTYPEIRIAVWVPDIDQRIEAFKPDAIHISTEGPIGFLVRRHCLKFDRQFTTSFHTRFPEYVRQRFPIPLDWSYSMVRNFHGPARRTLVPTETLKQELETKGFSHLQVWGRGVDTQLFNPRLRTDMGVTRPVMLSVGRLAADKNLDAFLELDLPGTRVVVGDGPEMKRLSQQYPDVIFTGVRFGEELARYFASADVFVFPSLTDTYGVVMLEAIACGTPVAAFPVTGPIDVLEQGVTGVMNDHLSLAIMQALKLDRDTCAGRAISFSWNKIAKQLSDALVPANNDKDMKKAGMM